MSSTTKKIFYWIQEKCSYLKIFLIFFILICPMTLKMFRILLSRKHIDKKRKKNLTIGFFHPNCSSCTPQENVLWSAVKAIQTEYSNAQICIYTGDLKIKSDEILRNVETQFDIRLQPNIKFVHLSQRKWIQSFAYMGSMWVGCEALALLKPHIMIDTMGYGFTNFIFKSVGCCKVISYVHNPLVSIDKLKTSHVVLLNNQYVLTRRSASSVGVSKAVASLYGWTGRSADTVMVNSLWTKENIDNFWRCSQKTHVVYPPIGLEKLITRADSYWEKKNLFRIINASEFKPENNHELILQALNKLRHKIKTNIMNEVRLILINLSTDQDESYINQLKDLVKQLNLEDYVKIYPQYIHANRLEEELIRASFGIYTKADDPFGSDIIAGLAAGQIMIVHDSGASKNELIVPKDDLKNGYLAKTAEQFAQALLEALNLSPEERRHIQKAARRTAEQFSRLSFQKRFLKLVDPLINCNNK